LTLRLQAFFVLGLFVVSFSIAASSSFAADVSWLAFLPKAERAKAVSRISAMDTLRASIAEDRIRSVVEEHAYAASARATAADLDRSGGESGHRLGGTRGVDQTFR